MNKNAVICGIEHVLRDEGCNEIPVMELYSRVIKLRSIMDVSLQDFMTILRELESDGLFEWFGPEPQFSEDSLIARSQMHPSVPTSGGAILL